MRRALAAVTLLVAAGFGGAYAAGALGGSQQAPSLRTNLRLVKSVPCPNGRRSPVGPKSVRRFHAVTAISCIDQFRTYPGHGQWEVLVRRVAVERVSALQKYFEQPSKPNLPKGVICSAVLMVTLVPVLVDVHSDWLLPRTPTGTCGEPREGGPPTMRWHVVWVHRIKQILSAAAVTAHCPMQWGNSVAWAGPPRDSAGGPLFPQAPGTVRICVFRTPPDRFAVGHFVRGFRRLDASRTRRLLRALTGAGPRRGCAKQRAFAVVIRSPGSVASVELGGCWRVDRPDRLAGTAKPAVVRAILGGR